MINYKTIEHITSNQWVTFVHGAGGSLATWKKQIDDFKVHYNLLLIDLRGHGDSKSENLKPHKEYTFKLLTIDIIDVLDHLKINKTHFVGISMGNIFIRLLGEIAPERIKSIVQGGPVLKFDVRVNTLVFIGNVIKNLVPYMMFYKLCAFILMPKRVQRKAKGVFIREAKKMCQEEFIKWYNLNYILQPILARFRKVELDIPTLYIVGKGDYIFSSQVKSVIRKNYKLAKLVVVDKCGHVVNLERPKIFNTLAIDFIKTIN